jgi:hypothetical protein
LHIQQSTLFVPNSVEHNERPTSNAVFQCYRYRLQIVGFTYRGRLLREPLTISWDKRRPLPRYATDYCAMLAAYMREVFPISRPTEPSPAGARRKRGRLPRR